MQFSGRFALLTICAGLLVLIGCSDDEETTQPPPPAPMTLVAADRSGNIVTVSEADGSETLIIDTFTNCCGGINDVGVVSSMLYEPATGAWWLGTGGNADCAGCIQTLDPATREATTLSDNSGILGGVPGLAIHPSTGKAYTTEADGSSRLYEINVNTGVVTQLYDSMNLGAAGKGCTFTANGKMYVAGDDELSEVDVATGDETLIGAFSFVGFPVFSEVNQSIGSLTTRSDGVVFGILKDGGGIGRTSTTYLVRINLTNAQVTNVGVNTGRLDGLAYVPTSVIP